jgi:hypothetical protein
MLFGAYVPYTSLAHIHAYHCIIDSNFARDQGALGGQHLPSRVKTNPPSFEQGKHRLHNLL